MEENEMIDYEKKYNEALERAQKVTRAGGDVAMVIIQDIFPELAENEDERIRVVILKLMLGMRDEIFTAQDELVTKPKVLAWLEKQKEQKPADLPAGFYVTLPDGKKYYTKEMRCNGMNVKVVEPKPAEWSEEDRRHLDRIQMVLESWDSSHTSLAGLPSTIPDDIDWLKSLRPSWKPSEEQMDRLFSIVAALRKDYCDDMADFLASLYEQLNSRN